MEHGGTAREKVCTLENELTNQIASGFTKTAEKMAVKRQFGVTEQLKSETIKTER